MTHNTSTTVPQKLVALVNRLGPFWAVFPDDDTEARQLRGERCAEFLKNEGASIAEVWPAGGGFINVLAGFEVDGRTWVVWTGIDACGVDPCQELTIDAMVECYSESAGEHYVWEPPLDPEYRYFAAKRYDGNSAATAVCANLSTRSVAGRHEMAFCFAPTGDQDVNERFCWLLMDWLTDQEREAADAAILAPLRGEVEDSGMKTPSHRRYGLVVEVARSVSAEMRGFKGLNNPNHGAEAIAQMIEPAIHPQYRQPVEGDSAASRFVARQHEKYGSGAAIVAMLVRQAMQQVKS